MHFDPYRLPGLLVTLPGIVIGSCVANAALHNNAQPPMGNIMLKVAGVCLAFFTAFITFKATTTVLISLGSKYAIEYLVATPLAGYVLYFAFSKP